MKYYKDLINDLITLRHHLAKEKKIDALIKLYDFIISIQKTHTNII